MRFRLFAGVAFSYRFILQSELQKPYKQILKRNIVIESAAFQPLVKRLGKLDALQSGLFHIQMIADSRKESK